MITAKLICDSVNPAGNRLSTFVLTYPRFIHSEFMTHRCFSRNAASSRAIPIHKMISAVFDNPAMPVFWGANQSGMQAAAELDEKSRAMRCWKDASEMSVVDCQNLDRLGLHKQIANRVLEPFSHITVVATSGEKGLRNFFGLRAHKDAQPEFQALAYAMLKEWLPSVPRALRWDGWHLPFYDPKLKEECENIYDVIRICCGRIARVSYLTHDGLRDPGKDLDLSDKLIASGHLSPFEHCAQAVEYLKFNEFSNLGPGWHQYRKTLPNECQVPTNAELTARLAHAPNWALNCN